ncbi:MAG: hypothetical protein WC004_01855 [Candidatus Absconditabacterales bacterium]
MIELLKKNASRCIALVVVEIVVMTVFHIIEGEQFVISELLALGLHLFLSLFGLCFYVIMRSKLKMSSTRWFDLKRIVGEPLLYLVFDFFIIHVIMGLAMGEFELHIPELIAIIVFVYGINLYFDTSKHHCCHDHCN